MKNPYEDIIVADEIRLSRGGGRFAIIVFLAVLLVPVLSFLVKGDHRSVTGPGVLRQLEERAKTMPLLEHWRLEDQERLTRVAGLGNRRVLAGHDGWLYYRTDLDAIHGKGPGYDEPNSVAREQVESAWRAPVPVVKAFADDLSSRGIELILVPVPTKPMVCREGLGLPGGADPPAVFTQVMEDLAVAGIEVVDLFPLLREMPADTNRFLKQDTHWTPTVMSGTARLVADRISAAGMEGGVLETRIETIARESRGDLVGMLGAKMDGEQVTLQRVVNETDGTLLASDPASPVVLLGDSFANIFEDPSLGFAGGENESIGAGFSSHFASALGQSVHTIAINGGGASAVREAFAALPGEVIAKKKIVVWLLSSRDLLLAEIPARRAGIEWREVTLPAESESVAPVPTSADGAGITGILREKSLIEDPAQTPYASAIYSTLFTTDDGQERLVFLWAFRDRKPDPGAALEPGRRYRLRLVPLEGHAEAARATRLDDFFRPELEPVFAESFAPAE